MNLDYDDEQIAVRDVARRIGLDVLAPAARQAEQKAGLPDKVGRTLFETGLIINTPERFGGGGLLDASTYVLAVEGLAYGDAGITMAAVWQAAAPMFLSLCGTPEQAEAFLPTLGADPDRSSAVALYEGYGRAPSEYATTITPQADGSWLVEGHKVAVLSDRHSDPLIVVGVDPAVGRLRAVVLRAADDGVAFGPTTEDLALAAAPRAGVTFAARVDPAALLGGVDGDPGALEQAIGRLRLAVAAAGIGTAQRAVEYAAAYATERVAFGRPIAAFQGVSFLLAEAQIRLAAARSEVAEAATQLDQPGRASLEATVTKAVNYAGAVATEASRDALQVLGGHGFITDHPVELWYRTTATLSALDFDPLCSPFEPAF